MKRKNPKKYDEFYREFAKDLPVLFGHPHFYETSDDSVMVMNFSESEPHNSNMFGVYDHFTAISKCVNYD